MRLLIEARDRLRQAVGPVTGYEKATLIPRHNEVGAWTIEIPEHQLPPEIAAAWADGGGIRAVDVDHPAAPPILSGPVTSLGTRWGQQDRYGGTLAVAGVSDLHVLSDRVTWPNPGSAWTAQNIAAYYTLPAQPAETAIRTLVNVQAGPGALAARQTPGLTLATDGGRGASVRVSTRFENLLDVARALALAGGDLGFRVDQTSSGGLVLSFYEPAIRSNALLSQDLGTVTSGNATREAPTVTRALVAGQGQGTARALRERADATVETEWGRRIEQLVDRRDSADTALLDQAGDEALAEGAARGAYQVSVIDGRDAVFGVDYGLGDAVPYVFRGVELQDVVREVRITATAGAVTIVEPVIGPADASATPALYRRVARLETAIRALHGRL